MGVLSLGVIFAIGFKCVTKHNSSDKIVMYLDNFIRSGDNVHLSCIRRSDLVTFNCGFSVSSTDSRDICT